jgi:hypothetical protein
MRIFWTPVEPKRRDDDMPAPAEGAVSRRVESRYYLATTTSGRSASKNTERLPS